MLRRVSSIPKGQKQEERNDSEAEHGHCWSFDCCGSVRRCCVVEPFRNLENCEIVISGLVVIDLFIFTIVYLFNGWSCSREGLAHHELPLNLDTIIRDFE